MALSYYSNWGAFQAPPQLPFDSNIDSFSFQPMELHQYSDADWNTVDSVFDTAADGFYSGNNYSCVPSYEIAPYEDFNFSFSFNSLAAEENYLLHHNCEPLHYPKRHKGCDYEQVYPEFKTGFFDHGIAPSPNFPNMEIPVPPPLLPDFPTTPPVYSSGTCENTPLKKEPGSLSAQSIAARQRRRKITEKTQELGKLVPGGQKMNTAEMLQAAYKYINFLQAQVGIFEFMNSYSQEEEEQQCQVNEELHDLLESPLIQEKLYSTENCLVPQKFVQELSSDHQIMKSNPALLPLIVKQEHSSST